MCRPILGAQAIGTFAPLRASIVFHVGEQNIDAYRRRTILGFQYFGQFGEYGHTACAIVGSINRFVLVLGVHVGPRATIPMGKHQDAVGGIGVDDADDVDAGQHFSITTFHFGFLAVHGVAPLVEVFGHPIGTLPLCFRARGAWPEFHLPPGIRVCGVGIKHRHLHAVRGRIGTMAVGGCGFVATCATRRGKGRNNGKGCITDELQHVVGLVYA